MKLENVQQIGTGNVRDNETTWLVRSFAERPLFHAGFRPFFILALAAAVALPLLWGLFYLGVVSFTRSGLTPLQWHAHEMIYGFGWAVLGGFLLTASKNWLKIRGIHGGALLMAATLWLIERVVIFSYSAETSLEYAIRFVLSSGSIFFVAGYVMRDLIRYRKQDTFKDNFFFLFVLPSLLVAKALILSADGYALGWPLAIGAFRLAFAVMFERTITQFMKTSFGVQLPRLKFLDMAIKFSILAAVFEAFLPYQIAAAVTALAGVLLLIRFFMWHPGLGISRLDTAVMYYGYLALSVHLLLRSLNWAWGNPFIGAFSVHVFTLFCMGGVIAGMLVRISQGHTGRKIEFRALDKIAINSIYLAAGLRLAGTQLWPGAYASWIAASSFLWAVGFALLALRLIPFLFRPRVDGRIH